MDPNERETFNGGLLSEDRSVRLQTLGKRVLDDPRHFMFQRRQPQQKRLSKIFDKNFRQKNYREKIDKAENMWSWLEDTCVLARRRMCPGQITYVPQLEDTCVLPSRHTCLG